MDDPIDSSARGPVGSGGNESTDTTTAAADRAFARYLTGRRPEDLAAVFDALAPRLLLFAAHVTSGVDTARGGGTAEDLVQATFLRAIETAPDRFERGRPVLPWLTGILVREARRMRRLAARTVDPERLEWNEEAAPADRAEWAEFRAALETALAELPRRYGEVLTLRLVHGLTPTQIAQARGESPETVKTRLRRGAEQLRGRLPAGLASMVLVCVGAGRSLSAVRAGVLASASAGTFAAVTAAGGATGAGAAGSAAAAAGGGTSKLVLGAVTAVAASVVGGATWWVLQEDPGAALPPVRTAVAFDDDGGRDGGPPGLVARPVDQPAEEAEDEAPPSVRPESVTVRGRVVRGRDGIPVRGLEVVALRLHADLFVAGFDPRDPAGRVAETLGADAPGLPERLVEPPLVEARATTDDLGSFVLDDVTARGSLLLQLRSADGRVVRQHALPRTPGPGTELDAGTFAWEEAIEVEGRVVDETGSVIPGARVRAAPRPWTSPPAMGALGVLLEALGDEGFTADGGVVLRDPVGGALQAFDVPPWLGRLYATLPDGSEGVVTDVFGRFRWVAAELGARTVTVEAQGFRTARAKVEVLQRRFAPENDAITLLRAPRRRGFVLGPSGAPRADVEVRVGFAAPQRNGRLQRIVQRGIGVTDARGEFAFHPWRDEPPYVSVRTGADEPWQVAGPFGSDDEIRIRIAARVDAFATVVDREGEPIERAELLLLPAGLVVEGRDPVGVAQRTALFELGALGGLARTVSAAADDRDGASGTEATAEDARAADLERGRAPAPRPGALRIRDLPAGTRWEVIAHAPGFEPGRGFLSVVSGAEVRIELARREPFEAEVGERGEDDVAGRLVAEPGMLRAGVGPSAFPRLVGRAGEDGVFVGERPVWQRAGLGLFSDWRGFFWHDLGVRGERVTIQGDRLGGVAGRVTSGGEPVEGGVVRLVPAGPSDLEEPGPFAAVAYPPVHAPVDGEGRFRFDPVLRAGGWRLDYRRWPDMVRHWSELLDLVFPDCSPADERQVPMARVHAGTTIDLPDFELHVRDGGPADEVEEPEETEEAGLRGRITVVGIAPDALSVRAKMPDATMETRVAADGSFDLGDVGRLPPLPPGPAGTPGLRSAVLEVVARGAWDGVDAVLWRRPFVFPAGGLEEPLDVDLGVAPANGSVRAPGGRGPAGQLVVLLDAELPSAAAGSSGAPWTGPPTISFRRATNARGWFEVDPIPFGTYRVRVMDPGIGWLDQEWTLDATVVANGLSWPLEPLLVAAGRVDGTALGVQVRRRSRLVVERDPGEDGVGLERSAWLAPDGGFELDGLLPGRYRVSLYPSRSVPGVGLVPGTEAVGLREWNLTGREASLRGLLLQRRAGS